MAYKVKRKQKGRIVIKGIEFPYNEVVTVSKSVFDYIMKSFKKMFEVVEQTAPQVAKKVTPQNKPTVSNKPVIKGKEKG